MVTVYDGIIQYNIKRYIVKGEVIESGYFYKGSVGYYDNWLYNFHEERQG